MFKKLLAILIVGAFIFSLTIPAFAQEAQGKAADTQVVVITEKTPASKDAVEVGNKICPVSGNKVPALGEENAMGDEPVKIEYKGKIYNLCCPMCIKDFKNNPEKYSGIADKEVSSNK
jgi:YHS domain-containing protein